MPKNIYKEGLGQRKVLVVIVTECQLQLGLSAYKIIAIKACCLQTLCNMGTLLSSDSEVIRYQTFHWMEMVVVRICNGAKLV